MSYEIVLKILYEIAIDKSIVVLLSIVVWVADWKLDFYLKSN